VTWTQQVDVGISHTGALWNDGGRPRLYLEEENSYAEFSSDKDALAMAAGYSMGAAHSVPSLFFPFVSGGNLVESLRDATVEGVDRVGGQTCRIVSGRLDTGVEYRLWIATNGWHVVQFENILGGASSETTITAMTPEQMAETLDAAGLEDTPESRRRVQENLEKARAMMAKVRGTTRMLHQDILMDRPMAVEEFSFTPPPGTMLRESMIDRFEEAKTEGRGKNQNR
jgi:hypothetical protein